MMSDEESIDAPTGVQMDNLGESLEDRDRLIHAIAEDYREYERTQRAARQEFMKKRFNPLESRLDASWVMAWTSLVVSLLSLAGVVWAIARI